MNLSVVFDHAQKRLAHDRIAAVAAGEEFDGPYWDHTWLDPVTKTLMLRPGPLYPEWYTSNTGKFEKLALSAFDPSDPDQWKEELKFSDAAGVYLSSLGNAPGSLLAKSTFGVNRGVYLSFFFYSAGDNYVVVEGGWNPNPNYLESVGFRIYGNGDFELWKNGALVGLYNISGYIVGDQKSNQMLDLMLIPCRRRELLVVSRQGNGFSHVFEDILETDEAPVIVPNQKFWVKFPNSKAQVQIAPIKYETTGYATGIELQLGIAPEGTDTLQEFDNPAFAGGADQEWQIWGDPPYAGSTPTTSNAVLVTKENGAFTANGENKDARVKVTITGDGNYTPFVYGAQVAYNAVIDETDASEETAVDEYLEEFAIDIPDDPTGVTFRVQLIEPDHLDATVLANLKRVNNRPAKLVLDGVTWIDAQGGSPQWDMSTSDATQRLTLEFRDRWKSLENYRFRDRVPLDGLQLVDALKFLVSTIGLQDDDDPAISDFDFDELDYRIEPIPQTQCGDFNVVIEIGDTAADWVLRLIEDYSATWFYGFKPTQDGVKFCFKSPATLDQADFVYELWPTIEEAIIAGKPELEAFKWVYRSYDEETLPPEANDIRVTGWDPRLRRAIQTHYPDHESQDPTIAPSARNDNWIGEPLLYGLIDPAITSQAICDGAAQLLFDRMTPVRIVGEIECEAMVLDNNIPVWRGDNVYLHGKGLYRVVSGCIDSEKEPYGVDAWQWRPARYCLELRSAEVLVIEE